MKWLEKKLNKNSLSSLLALIFSYFFLIEVSAQETTISEMAQRVINENSSSNEGSEALDVFKFSVNEILNSLGDTVENSNGDPNLFGRTDYGSEFAFSNDLSTSLKIEIPAFVIEVLAETATGDYFPIIKNGNEDSEDGTYVNTYSDDALGTQVTEYFNASAPNKIETVYDTGLTEIEYINESGINVKDHIYQDGSIYKTFFLMMKWMSWHLLMLE